MSEDHLMNEMSDNAKISSMLQKKPIRQSMMSQWGIICVVIAVVATQFRPQLAQLMKELGPVLVWLRQKLYGEKGAVGGAPTNVKEQQVVVSKLSAVGAKVYGSMHCSWTRRQLEIIGLDVTSELFVDCDKDPTQCANIQAFPTWSIQGKTEPGYLPLDALGMIADGVLLKAYNSQAAVGSEPEVVAPDVEDEEASPEVVAVAPEVVEVVAPEVVAPEVVAPEVVAPAAVAPAAVAPVAVAPEVVAVAPEVIAEPEAVDPVSTAVFLEEEVPTTKKRGREGRAVVLVDEEVQTARPGSDNVLELMAGLGPGMKYAN
jgi:hypothetical protein